MIICFQKRFTHMLALLVLAALFASGCASPSQFIKQTNDFAIATSNVSDSMKGFLDDSQGIEFELALSDYVYNGSEIPTDAYDKRTFSPELVQARYAALQTLSDYATVLARASQQDHGEEFRKQVQGFSNIVSELEPKFSAFKKAPVSPAVFKGARMLFAIAGELGGAIISQHQVDELRKTILKASQPVKDLATILAKDMEQVFIPMLYAKRTRLMAMAIRQANSDFESGYKTRKGLVADMRPVIQEVRDTEQAASLFVATMGAYQQAVGDLVSYARDSQNPLRIGTMTASITLFVDRAQRLVGLIEQERTQGATP